MSTGAARAAPLAGPRSPRRGIGSRAPMPDLETHEIALTEVQLRDFRAANLFRLVSARLVPGGRVLDVGCGASGLVASLLERGVDASGIDASASIIEAAAGFLRARGLDASRVSTEPLSALVAQGATFDSVVSMDCLEHVEDDAAMLRDLVRVLRPGGTLVVTVPALMALYGERDRLQGHFRRYDRPMLRALAAEAPLELLELRYWNLLGVAPTYVSHRLLHRTVDESFRYGAPSLPKRLLRQALFTWFEQVENRFRPPLGMTLLLVARRKG